MLLAVGPQLAGISPNTGALLEDGAVLNTAPQELVFRFNEGQEIDPGSLGGIVITRGGGDGRLDDNADGVVDALDTNVSVEAGFVGLGDFPNQVVFRFADALPDDVYQIDVLGTGASALQNVTGDPFDGDPSSPGVQDFRLRFRLDLAPQIVAVVPQPVRRSGDGLVQDRTKIVVYFNQDELDPNAAVNPDFYKLILTNDTVTNTDDTVFAPSASAPPVYDAGTHSVVLTFDALATEIGTFRLRVGSSEALPLPPQQENVPDDPGSSFSTATDLHDAFGFQFDSQAGSDIQSVILSSAIDPQPFGLDFPGSNHDPGHRQINIPSNQHVPDGGADATDGISEIAYNFRAVYGTDSDGNTLLNQITDRQKARAREIFELYGNYLGVQFVETADSGFAIATGDLTAVDPFISTEFFDSISGNVPGFGPTAILDASQTWNDQFGNNWFREAMRRVGQLLGLGGTFDLPAGTIMGDDPRLTFGTGPEPVFPGDHDIVHGQYLYRPDSVDIDLYRFTIDVSLPGGVLTAETFAQRQADSSLLDTVLRLYRETDNGQRELVSQNDDYFGNDSLIEMALEPGTYYVGVSASGNDAYDPAIEGTGFGGVTQGNYDLRLTLRPSTSRPTADSTIDTTIIDATGVPLDGDADGQPGGDFNYWFRTQTPERTLFVDKAHAGSSDGTAASPFTTIRDATQHAADGDIVRIAGNGGADGDVTTLTDNLPYQIGISGQGVELPDGRSLEVPKGVTMMVDAGAIFKMRRSAITVGSSSPLVDRSGATLQVLGTPQQRVFFTSIDDEDVGKDTTVLATTPNPGDWGGIIVRGDVDHEEQRFDYENEGVFLNSIYQAELRYGGGAVVGDSVSGVVNPVHIVRARPSIAFNRIMQSADAAMSATPDSFAETNFHAPEFQTTVFTSDYGRIGPDIHSNVITGNTTNGLFIRIPKLAGNVLQPMRVSGRLDDTDIVHILTDNLLLAGQPGGPVENPVTGLRTARLSARLIADPGIVVKAEGARIEAQIGANFYAEGTNERQVVFTSLQDDRFGAGGTFDTNNGDAAPVPGDWGGIIIRQTGIVSLDHALVAFAGGINPMEGSFAGVNAVEIHQATARIAHSVFENNASGTGGLAPAARFGRGANAPATIFVRGAQPVIVENIFRGNDSPVININANALNHAIIVDRGRSIGAVDRMTSFADNQGPLVRGNVLNDNAINGMEIRGGTLTTEAVWDDTDIVHVLRDTIYIPNLHTFGGLRLESRSNESLVVKLLGDQAGFVTTGTQLEIADPIGGRLEVVGQPGHPVVLTSLYDDTVGAGSDQNGQPQTDTNNGGRPSRSRPEGTFHIDLKFGPLILQNPEAVAAARRAASMWELQFEDPITVVVDVELANLGAPPIEVTNTVDPRDPNTLMRTIAQKVRLPFDEVRDALVRDGRDHEALLKQLPALSQLNVVLPDDPVNPFTVAETMQLTRANAKALGFGGGSLAGQRSEFDPLGLEIRDAKIEVSDDPNLWDYQRRDGLRSFREDFVSDFMRQLGEALGFTSSVDDVESALLAPNSGLSRDIAVTPLDLFRFAPGHDAQDFTAAPRLLDPTALNHVFFAGGSFDPNTLGLPIAGLQRGDIPLSRGVRDNTFADNEFGAARWLDDVFVRDDKLVEFTPLGVMDPIHRFRDEVFQLLDPVQSTLGLITNITDQDREAFDSIGYDAVGGTPGDWQGIRLEQLTHTENSALVLEAESSELAAPGNNAVPESAQFIGTLAPDLRAGDDNQRLAFEIHGLLNEPGDVDLYSFTATAGTPIWLDIDQTSPSLDSVIELIDANGTMLARSDNSAAEQAGEDGSLQGILAPQPLGGFDHFTTNPLDAGMQLVLPGVAGTTNNYLVRVRSSSADLDGGLFDGLTSGQYQLQIRLRAADAFPGTTVEFADIRFAETGIDVIGPPVQSPLLGTAVEDTSLNDTPFEPILPILDDEGNPIEDRFVNHPQLPFEVSAQDVGNLLASNQGAISVFGALSQSNDVDWFQFEVNYDAVESVPGAFDLGAPVGVVFDIDYAASLGRPNTVLSIFDSFGNLVFFGDDSQVADDLSAPGTSNGATDLSRGSASRQDPFIGPVVLHPGTYYAVVSSAAFLPAAIVTGGANLTPIIEGVTGRGQRVTGGTGPTFFEPNPSFPSGDVLTGEYQLGIRYTPVPNGGFTAANASVADKNRVAIQGQLLIDSNIIRDSRTWGVAVADGLRDFPVTDFFGGFDFTDPLFSDFNRFFALQDHAQFTSADYAPHAAPARALPVLDEERIVPGVSVTNNVLAGGIDGGVSLQGDPNGIVIDTYNLKFLTDLFSAFDGSDIDGTEFTIWDHQRHSVTFEFDNSGGVKEGHIPIRFDTDPNNDSSLIVDEFRWTNPPTRPEPVAAEIEQAIRFSDLDVKVYRAKPGELFVEGAVEIGSPDVIVAPFRSVFFPPDSPLPVITAYKVQQGSVPFARIVNNTFVGRGGDLFEASGHDDVAVLLEDNVSPTILNNIVANFDTGFQSDLTSTDATTGRRTFLSSDPIGQDSFRVTSVFESQFDDKLGPFLIAGHGFDNFFSLFSQLEQNIDADPTNLVAPRPSVIGATVYQGNLTDSLQVGVGDFPIQLANSDPLFVDPSSGNFLLQEGSRAIDSSVGRLAERERMAAISGPVGISASDILAPRLDAQGQLRVDDPNVEPPAGFGNNAFKDRGALDRVDFVGPAAVLLTPGDNDAAGLDTNPGESVVRLVGGSLDRFSIQIVDGLGAEDPSGGTGADDRTVTSSAVTVTRDGQLLADRVDYRFGYDTTNNVIRLTPLAGVWEPGHIYAITLAGIRDLAGNPIKPNQITGKTQFTISLDIESDFGDAPSPYPTLAPDGPRHTIAAGLFLGAGVTGDEDGQPTAAANGDSLDDGVVFNDRLLADSAVTITVTASAGGLLDAWIDFNGDGDWNDDGEQIFASKPLVAGQNILEILTPPTTATGISYARFRFSSAGGLLPTGSAPDGEVEDYVVTLGSTNPWQNSPNPLNVDNDAADLVTPLDALIIINELNNPQFSDLDTGALPIPAPIPPGASSEAPFFYDVNGDGFIAPIDALVVINVLNSMASSQGSVAASTVAASTVADRNQLPRSADRPELLFRVAADMSRLQPDGGQLPSTGTRRPAHEPVRAVDDARDPVLTVLDAVHTVQGGGFHAAQRAGLPTAAHSKTDTVVMDSVLTDSVLDDIATDILLGWRDKHV